MLSHLTFVESVEIGTHPHFSLEMKLKEDVTLPSLDDNASKQWSQLQSVLLNHSTLFFHPFRLVYKMNCMFPSTYEYESVLTLFNESASRCMHLVLAFSQLNLN